VGFVTAPDRCAGSGPAAPTRFSHRGWTPFTAAVSIEELVADLALCGPLGRERASHALSRRELRQVFSSKTWGRASWWTVRQRPSGIVIAHAPNAGLCSSLIVYPALSDREFLADAPRRISTPLCNCRKTWSLPERGQPEYQIGRKDDRGNHGRDDYRPAE
jgi:hypothetical protein